MSAKASPQQKRSTIKRRLMRSTGYTLIVAILLVATVLSWVGNKDAKKNLIGDLSVIGQIIANRSSTAMFFAEFADKEAIQENLESASFHSDINLICVFDRQGDLYHHYTNHPTANRCDLTQTYIKTLNVIDDGNLIRVRIPILHSDEHYGTIEIYSNNKGANQAFLRFALTLAFTLAIALFVAYFIGGRLVTSSLGPLTKLFKTSQEIAASPYANIRAGKHSNDEISDLVEVFNNILDNLESDNAALTASESRFRVLAEHAPIGIFLKNHALDLDYTNERWADITGLSKNQADAFCNNIDTKDSSLYESVQERARSQHSPQVIEYSYTTPLGSRRILMEHIAPLSDSQGFRGFVGSLLDVTELKTAQMELEKLAFYDPLTDLPNRRFFRGHLELTIASAKKYDKKLAVLMTDLDDFKKINDTFGHDAGDRLLTKIGSRLKAAAASIDVVSRMGGDEFMVLIKNVESSSQLEHKTQLILAALNEKIELNNQLVEVGGSIGVAVFPNDAIAYEELIRYADIALYNAKAQGGNTVSYYSSDLDKRIKDKMRLEQKLRQALENDKLDVFIQPIYDAQTREMYKGEALARWFDEEDGYMRPDIFVPLAEESGLIYDLGRIVLEKVCIFIRDNKDKLQSLGMHSIAVNLSARQFFSSQLLTFIRNSFIQYEIDPTMVEFELTESMVMDDVSEAIGIMRSIRNLGCKLSIDDFGTGYSSLSYLKQFPINTLKIDRSFIKDIPEDKNDIEIACTIIAMAHNMGLTVVAEGVETREQWQMLKDQNCDHLQGYYFSKPLPMAEILALDNILSFTNDSSA
ncbi:bifunctional diguanylate cyclase/phosphodiesterase [Teredinibacter purpureus]|uniref:bifunctional diguanylate cyclase/phosphodiesterase n=1 Tax=Teredinibacter purpureus TaxID=2731756 RepID=UPI0005F7ED05|nr:EAL domain-containing protein [Teredinibacter purpureus]